MSGDPRLTRRSLLSRALRGLAALAAVPALAGEGCAGPRAPGARGGRGAARVADPGAALESELRDRTLFLRWPSPSGGAHAGHPGALAAVVAVDAVTQRPRLRVLGAAGPGGSVTLSGPRAGAPDYRARVDVGALLGLEAEREWFVHASYLQHRSAVYLLRAGPSSGSPAREQP